MNLEFNLENELLFLSLFDLHAVTLDFKNIWMITDKNNRYRGYIKKQPIIKEDGTTTVGYHTVVIDNKIKSENYRCADDQNFMFKINLWDQPDITIEVKIGERSKLVIKYKDREVGHLFVDDKTIDLTYNLITQHYNVRKDIVLNDDDDNYKDIRGTKAYAYCLSYIPRTGPLANHEFYQQCCCLRLDNNKVGLITALKNPNVVENDACTKMLDGTVEQAFHTHNEAAESFAYFRDMVRINCPFTEDVVALMIRNSELGQKMNIFDVNKKYFFKK